MCCPRSPPGRRRCCGCASALRTAGHPHLLGGLLRAGVVAQLLKQLPVHPDHLVDGLHHMHPRTLEEVGKEFNVTRERIRQIEAKALRKLRHPSRSKKLKDSALAGASR